MSLRCLESVRQVQYAVPSCDVKSPCHHASRVPGIAQEQAALLANGETFEIGAGCISWLFSSNPSLISSKYVLERRLLIIWHSFCCMIQVEDGLSGEGDRNI